MNRALFAVLLFMLGMPPQVKHPQACDHAAPPQGMRWVCASENPCDCHLEPIASEANADRDPADTTSKPYSHATPGPGVACRIAFFVIPGYPEAAREGQKQGIVSASLILTADGKVEQVRIQSGDPQLAAAVRSAFQQWRFMPGKPSETIPVSVKFVLSDSPSGSVTGTSLLNPVVTAPPTR
ncbi:MAG: energy transducer TonB [Terriglobales bacterium]